MMETGETWLISKIEMLSDSCDETADVPHAHLEVVVLDGGVGEHRADAVLAEAGRMNMKVAEQVANRGEDVSVAFQLDDDELAGVAVVACLVIVETDVEVDGESFGFAVVYQGYAVEVVLHHFLKIFQLEKGVFGNEFACAFLVTERIKSSHTHTFLLRASVVVLVLHLEEGEVARTEIGPYPHFLAVAVSAVVLHVHGVVGCVEVGGAVWRYEVTIGFLHIIFPFDQFEQLAQFGFGGHVLRVQPVHQLDGRHLVQGDWLQFLEQVQDPFVIRHTRFFLVIVR